MRIQNLNSIWDISIWGNDERKTWLMWETANLPPKLEEEWKTLKYCLQGKSPLKKGKKDKRGWGDTFWNLHYNSKVSTHNNSPPHPSRSNNLESHLDFQVNSEDRYVCMDHGSQRYFNWRKI
jgi:hypothetical protein